jgi:hypothetical protein
MFRIRHVCFAAALLAVATFPVSADTLWVDVAYPGCPGSGTALDPFCSIQAAVDAASSFDTLAVRPGTYVENVWISDKVLTLVGRGGAAVTTIQGWQELPTVTVLGALSAGTEIRGFTITGGKGLVLGGTAFNTDLAGAGIHAGADVTIRNNVIENNVFSTSLTYTWNGVGGGIAVLGATALIEGNVIRSNSCTDGCGIYYAGGDDGEIRGNTVEDHLQASSRGGGLVIDGCAPWVVDNLIRNNVASVGAGLAIGFGAAPLVEGNSIVDNYTDEDEGGGVLIFDSAPELRGNTITGNSSASLGGGIYAQNSASVIVDNLIEGNHASTDGGGIWTQGDARIEGNVIADNVTFGRTGGMTAYGSPTIVRNVIRDHGASGLTLGGGAPVVTDNLILRNRTGIDRAFGVIRRNTVAENAYDGITVEDGATPLIESCIVWGNGASPTSEIFVFSGAPSVSFCDVRGGHAGTGNIGLDPMFLDEPGDDYRLAPGSACIDAGDPADVFCGLDVGDHPRRLDGSLNGQHVMDMGAHEFGHIYLDASLSPTALTVATSGTPGLPVVMIVALQPGMACFSAYGPLLFDPSAPWVLVGWSSNPHSETLGLAPGVPVPSVVLQALLLTVGGQYGNLSNAELVEAP